MELSGEAYGRVSSRIWEVGTMSRMKSIACSICMILVGVGPAAAGEGSPPKSLPMRSRPQSPAARSGKNVAQAPSPDQPAPDGSQPGADKSGNPAAPAASEPAASSSDAAPAATVQAGEQASEMSEAEFEKLAEQTTQEEVIVVTGSTIARKTLTTPAPLSILSRATLAA